MYIHSSINSTIVEVDYKLQEFKIGDKYIKCKNLEWYDGYFLKQGILKKRVLKINCDDDQDHDYIMRLKDNNIFFERLIGTKRKVFLRNIRDIISHISDNNMSPTQMLSFIRHYSFHKELNVNVDVLIDAYNLCLSIQENIKNFANKLIFCLRQLLIYQHNNKDVDDLALLNYYQTHINLKDDKELFEGMKRALLINNENLETQIRMIDSEILSKTDHQICVNFLKFVYYYHTAEREKVLFISEDILDGYKDVADEDIVKYIGKTELRNDVKDRLIKRYDILTKQDVATAASEMKVTISKMYDEFKYIRLALTYENNNVYTKYFAQQNVINISFTNISLPKNINRFLNLVYDVVKFDKQSINSDVLFKPDILGNIQLPDEVSHLHYFAQCGDKVLEGLNPVNGDTINAKLLEIYNKQKEWSKVNNIECKMNENHDLIVGFNDNKYVMPRRYSIMYIYDNPVLQFKNEEIIITDGVYVPGPERPKPTYRHIGTLVLIGLIGWGFYSIYMWIDETWFINDDIDDEGVIQVHDHMTEVDGKDNHMDK